MIDVIGLVLFKKIEKNLQFLFTIVLFFPLVLQITLGENSSNITINQWIGVVLVPLITSYLILEVRGEKIFHKLGRLVYTLLLIEIGIFIPVMYINAVVQKDRLLLIWKFFYSGSFILMIAIPTIILIILLVEPIKRAWTLKKS